MDGGHDIVLCVYEYSSVFGEDSTCPPAQDSLTRARQMAVLGPWRGV